MAKIIKFADIQFQEISFNELKNTFHKKNLFVFPSAPCLARLDKEDNYYSALKNADIAMLDSGFFCLLIFFKKWVFLKKFSGLNFIHHLLVYLKDKHETVLFIEPSEAQAHRNKRYLNKIMFNCKFTQYIAPIYPKNDITDPSLINIIKKNKPSFIIINLAGLVQEVIGSHIKNSINYNANIFCLGAAIAFKSGNQAPAPVFLDNFYLSWLVRCVFSPTIFFPRYIKAFRLVKVINLFKLEIVSKNEI